MKVFTLLALLALSACALAADAEAMISSVDDDELDPFTAGMLETFGGLLDDAADNEDDDLTDGNLSEDEIDDDDTEEVLHANITTDGMIEVEDMIVSPEMFDVMFPSVPEHDGNTDSETIHRRAAVSSKRKLWPRGRIPYSYHSNLLGSQAKVRAAMDVWERHTCVKFEYRKSSETKYVQIRTKMSKSGKPEPVCSSAVGYTRKRQYLNLAKNCFSHKVILHELGHVLGLVHEQQHPARDKYVTIVWNNINPKKKGNFNSRSKSVSSWGITYDPTSVMHYRSTAFRKAGCQKPCYTIVSKQGNAITKLIGTNKTLSKKSDIPIVTKMYCPASTSNSANAKTKDDASTV